MEDVGGSRARGQMHLQEGGWQQSLRGGTSLWVAAEVGLSPRTTGRGSGHGIGGTLGRKPARDVAVALWVRGGVGLCVPLCS